MFRFRHYIVARVCLLLCTFLGTRVLGGVPSGYGVYLFMFNLRLVHIANVQASAKSGQPRLA